MKKIATIFLTLFIFQSAIGQDDYDRFIQAILKGDTVLAAQIESDYADENKIEPISEYPFPVKNIPGHIFKLNINTLKDTLVDFFKIEYSPEENKYMKKVFYFYMDTIVMSVFFSTESSKDAIFSREYFLQPNTANDIYLTAMDGPWLSKYYYSVNQPIKYTAEFVFKLTKIDENSTAVKVVTINPEIISGKGLGVHGPMSIYTKAQPTTIEEYSLLLFIADKLGDRTLLPLKLPNSQ